jgi:hypothetical protein
MTRLPALLFVTAATALGIYLGVLFLRRVRRPVLIGVHLILGAAAVEMTAMLLRGTPGGEAVPAGAFGVAAACLLAVAMISGFAAPLFYRQSPRTANVVLATHAGVGVAGFLVFLVWAASA